MRTARKSDPVKDFWLFASRLFDFAVPVQILNSLISCHTYAQFYRSGGTGNDGVGRCDWLVVCNVVSAKAGSEPGAANQGTRGLA